MTPEWNDEPLVTPEWQEVRRQMRPWVKPEPVPALKRKVYWLTYFLALFSLGVGYVAASAIWQGYWPSWTMIPAAGLVAAMCWAVERSDG